MICSICGGIVEWQGALSNLTHTKCLSCGAINSQKIDQEDEDTDELDLITSCKGVDNWYKRASFEERLGLYIVEHLEKEAGWKENLLVAALTFILSGYDVSAAARKTNLSETDIKGAMQNKELMNKAKKLRIEKSPVKPDQSNRNTPPSRSSTNLDQIVNIMIKHEGLLPGETPFRITSPEMKKWNSFLGFAIDKTIPKPQDRQNFIYFKNPDDVPKAVKAQMLRYIQNPERYNLSANPTVKEVVHKFDQSGAANKIRYMLQHIPLLDINAPLSKYI